MSRSEVRFWGTAGCINSITASVWMIGDGDIFFGILGLLLWPYMAWKFFTSFRAEPQA